MKPAIWWLTWPAGLVLLGFAALFLGATGATWPDVWTSLGADPEGQAAIIARYRLPRVAAGALVGLHFGLAGAILQVVLRNPLADPTIFGVSGGASMAVVLAMSAAIAVAPPSESINVATNYLPLAWLPPIALSGALIATAVVIALAWDHRLGTISPTRMVLMGVVLGAILNAAVMALVLSLSESRTELAILWLSGSLYARGFENLWPALPWTVAGVALTLALMPSLSALRFDSQTAQSLGVRLKLAVPLSIAGAAALAASAVAVAGPVGFVGLLAPHMAGWLGGVRLGERLWASAAIGAGLVVAADALGRIVIAPAEMPVGIVTSLIGAPVFAALLTRKYRRLHATVGE
ncbi:MAG: iron ABC transporter permease [Pseudomonadota bacterium]